MSDYIVQFNNISKFFGKVIALKDVTMKLKKGIPFCGSLPIKKFLVTLISDTNAKS